MHAYVHTHTHTHAHTHAYTHMFINNVVFLQYLSLMKELGEVVPGSDSTPKPVSNNPITAGTAVPPPPSLVRHTY